MSTMPFSVAPQCLSSNHWHRRTFALLFRGGFAEWGRTYSAWSIGRMASTNISPAAVVVMSENHSMRWKLSLLPTPKTVEKLS